LRVHLLAGDGAEELEELGAERIPDVLIVVTRRLRGRCDRRWEVHFPDRRDESNNFDAVGKLKVFLCYRSGSDATDRLAGATASSAAARLYAVLLEVGPVCVARTGV